MMNSDVDCWPLLLFHSGLWIKKV